LRLNNEKIKKEDLNSSMCEIKNDKQSQFKQAFI
jgi:hypothetical protein